MNDRFGTTGEYYGYYLTIAGVIGAVNMGYLIPNFRLKKFSADTVNIVNHISLAV
jgi:hypothetical protein